MVVNVHKYQLFSRRVQSKMYPINLILLLVITIYNTQASSIFVNIKYEIADGQFMLFERYKDRLVLNEYPTFYSTNNLPNNALILSEENYTLGHTIGSHENYYPITSLKNELMCGHFNFRELVGYNHTIYYRDYWWENVEDFYSDMESTLTFLNHTFCFVYV